MVMAYRIIGERIIMALSNATVERIKKQFNPERYERIERITNGTETRSDVLMLLRDNEDFERALVRQYDLLQCYETALRRKATA
jgi:stalled ribosome rescue protein Dom34